MPKTCRMVDQSGGSDNQRWRRLGDTISVFALPGPTLTRGRRNFALYLTRGTPISVPRISTHFSLARLLREHSHHDTPPRSLQGHPHHDHGEQKADDTSGRESPDLNPRLGKEAPPARLTGQTTERKAPSFLALECTKASDAGGTTSARHHDAPEAGNPRGCSLPSHMCGLGEGANPPGPHAVTPEREGACSPEMEQTRLEH